MYQFASKAPMSQPGPLGRSEPRWSIAGGGHTLPGMKSIAGLPASSAWVSVAPAGSTTSSLACAPRGALSGPRTSPSAGPPLSASGPRFGLTPFRSGAGERATRVHALSLARLKPSERIAPRQLPPAVLFATIVLWATVVGAAVGKANG